MASWFKERFYPVYLAAIGFYLALNLIFLAQSGLTSPELGNAPRTMIFLLVLLTKALGTYGVVSNRSTYRS